MSDKRLIILGFLGNSHCRCNNLVVHPLPLMQGHEGQLSCQRNFVLSVGISPGDGVGALGGPRIVSRPQSVPKLLLFT